MVFPVRCNFDGRSPPNILAPGSPWVKLPSSWKSPTSPLTRTRKTKNIGLGTSNVKWISRKKCLLHKKKHIVEIQLYHFVIFCIWSAKKSRWVLRPETWHLKGANQQTWKGANPTASYDFYSPSKITKNQSSKIGDEKTYTYSTQ